MNNGQKEAAESGTALEFPDEHSYLEEVKEALQAALRESEDTVARYDREYREQHQYIVDYRHEIDPKEIFVSTQGLRAIERAGVFSVGLRDKIAKLADSPYFARIDFRSGLEGVPSSIYVGRFAFAEDEEHVIYDWRAPISSMFYDCELGAAGYDAPGGRVEGELTRRRQFKIAGGVMEYCLESALHIQDDVLQRELSHAADEKMRTIISTIQREQNRIIRSERAEVLVIQGGAGSGKTSIALHRVAYLLYRHRERLAAGNVAILSPNRVFGDYIGGVLPELGEEPIYQMSFEDIANIQLEGTLRFEPPRDCVEAQDPLWARRAAFKSTLDFRRRMDEYLGMATDRCFQAKDYSWESLSVPADFIQERYRAYRKHPVRRRLEETAADVLDRLASAVRWGEKLPGQPTVRRKLAAMLSYRTALALYRDFYRWLDSPDMLAPPAKDTLEWEDMGPYLYFHAAFEGLKENRIIRHLVVDEMQDYTPAQFALLDILFPCGKTILGDCGQVVNPHQRSTLEDLRQLYPGAELVRLRTSYRSTWEIIAFARGILPSADIQPVERHGSPVEVCHCSGQVEEAALLRECIRAFQRSERHTMGIILKTERRAREVYQLLRDRCEVQLLDARSTAFSSGISITCVRMSKGLEFDEVVIAGVDGDAYHSQFDRNLLYIACTRALHKLTLLCPGAPCGLLPQDAGLGG